jgi:hypothetical protein|tara:strand:- start:1363 stop:1755 length:393 start_codon:yes stop_codon:yes gene_type:complete
MTNQEAYNKGLDDSENDLLTNFGDAVKGVKTGTFANPKLEELREIIVTNASVTPPDYNKYEALITSIVADEDMEAFEMPESTRISFSIFRQLMEKFRGISQGGSNVGKSYKKVIEDNVKLLTSDKSMVNS